MYEVIHIALYNVLNLYYSGCPKPLDKTLLFMGLAMLLPFWLNYRQSATLMREIRM